MLHRLTDEPPARAWHNCTMKTCSSLETLAENMDSAVGSKVSFVDMHGTHRKFFVIQVAEDGSGFTIKHPRVINEGVVTLKVRRVSLKLLGAQYNEVKKTIELYSKVSGNMMLSVPFADHEKKPGECSRMFATRNCSFQKGGPSCFHLTWMIQQSLTSGQRSLRTASRFGLC